MLTAISATILVIAAVVISLAIAIPVTSIMTKKRIKAQESQKIGSAQEKARAIIDEALSTAESKKREALLEAKEENMKAKADLDKEIKDRRNEVQRNAERKLSGMSAEFSRRKSLSTGRAMHWNARNSRSHPVRNRCGNGRKKLQNLGNSVHRNSNEFQV